MPTCSSLPALSSPPLSSRAVSEAGSESVTSLVLTRHVPCSLDPVTCISTFCSATGCGCRSTCGCTTSPTSCRRSCVPVWSDIPASPDPSVMEPKVLQRNCCSPPCPLGPAGGVRETYKKRWWQIHTTVPCGSTPRCLLLGVSLLSLCFLLWSPRLRTFGQRSQIDVFNGPITPCDLQTCPLLTSSSGFFRPPPPQDLCS